MIEITDVNVSKNVVQTEELFIITVTVKERVDYPYDYPHDYPVESENT